MQEIDLEPKRCPVCGRSYQKREEFTDATEPWFAEPTYARYIHQIEQVGNSLTKITDECEERLR